MRVQMLKSIVCVFILFHAASKFWIVDSYFLKGPRAGQSDVITQNLPGYPDNIKLNSRQNFYVGLGSVRYQGVSLLGPFLDLIGPYPAIKRFLTKVYFPLSYFRFSNIAFKINIRYSTCLPHYILIFLAWELKTIYFDPIYDLALCNKSCHFPKLTV